MKSFKVWGSRFSFALLGLSVILVCLSFSVEASAYWVWSSEAGRFINPDSAVEGTAEDQYLAAMKSFDEENYKQATEEFEILVRQFPTAPKASEGLYQLSRLYEKDKDHYKAFKTLQKLIERYPGSERTNEAMERQYEIGHIFLSGEKGKFLGVPILPSLPRAIESFKTIVENAPFGRYGDKASYNLGLAYKQNGMYEKATEIFENFIENYPASPLLSDAKFQLGDVAFAKATRSASDTQGLKKAGQRFEDILAGDIDDSVRTKAEGMRKTIDTLNAEKTLGIADYYQEQGYVDSAMIYYEEIIHLYPELEVAQLASERLEALRAPEAYYQTREKELAREILSLESQVEVAGTQVALSTNGANSDISTKIVEIQGRKETLKDKLKMVSQKKSQWGASQWAAYESEVKELDKNQKIFASRVADAGDEVSPELAETFSNWKMSLDQEARMLSRVRSELEGAGIARPRKFGIPLWPKKDALEKVRSTHGSELNEIDLKLAELRQSRESLSQEYAAVDLREQSLEEKKSLVVEELQEFEQAILAQEEALQEDNGAYQKRLARIDELKSSLESMANQTNIQGDQGILQSVVSAPGRAIRFSVDALTMPAEWLGKDLGAKDLSSRLAVLDERIGDKEKLIELLNTSLAVASAEDVESLDPRENLEKAAPITATRVEVPDFSVPEESTQQKEDRASLFRGLGDRPVVARVMPEDVRLKKRIRLLEKEMRWRAEEIEDRNRTRVQLLADLNHVLDQSDADASLAQKSLRLVTSPVGNAGRLMKAFVVGLPSKDERVSQRAEHHLEGMAPDHSVLELKEALELEAVMIDVRTVEIEKMQKDLDAMKKEAESMEDFSYMSAFFELPGSVLGSVRDNALKIFKTDKEDKSTFAKQRLQDESRKLEHLTVERERLIKALEEVKSTVDMKTSSEDQSQETVGTEALKEKIVDEEGALRKEKEMLARKSKRFEPKKIADKKAERFGLSEKEILLEQKEINVRRHELAEKIRINLADEERTLEKQTKYLEKRFQLLSDKRKSLAERDPLRGDILEEDLAEIQDKLTLIQQRKEGIKNQKLLIQ